MTVNSHTTSIATWITSQHQPSQPICITTTYTSYSLTNTYRIHPSMTYSHPICTSTRYLLDTSTYNILRISASYQPFTISIITMYLWSITIHHNYNNLPALIIMIWSEYRSYHKLLCPRSPANLYLKGKPHPHEWWDLGPSEWYNHLKMKIDVGHIQGI